MKYILLLATALVIELSQNHNDCVSCMGMIEKEPAELVQESSCMRL
jgi:hypothetical protein